MPVLFSAIAEALEFLHDIVEPALADVSQNHIDEAVRNVCGCGSCIKASCITRAVKRARMEGNGGIIT